MKKKRKLARRPYEPMHPADIQAAIKKAGHTHKSLVNSLKLDDDTASMVSHVIHGRYRSRQIESLISEVIAIPPHKLWPKWYPKKGVARVA